VSEKSGFVYTEEPIVFCLELSKIITDDTSVAFCISKGFSFQVLDGISEAKNMQGDATSLTHSKSRTHYHS